MRLSPFESTADTIAAEIDDRRTFLADMRAMGQAGKHEANITREIKERVAELKRLDSIIAAKR
jgi:hypothetical protein